MAKKKVIEQLSNFKVLQIILNKTFLFLGFTFLIGITIWQMVDVFQDYIKEPIITLLVMEPFRTERMPIVTICRDTPLVGIDYEKVNADFNASEQLIKFIILGSGFLPRDTFSCFSSLDLGDWPDRETWDKYEWEYKVFYNKTNVTTSSQLVRFVLANYSVNERNVDCVFNGYEQSNCSVYFKPILNLQKGLCLTLTKEGRDKIVADHRFSVDYYADKRVKHYCKNKWIMSLSDTYDAMLPLYGTEMGFNFGYVKKLGVSVSSVSRIKNCKNADVSLSKYLPRFPEDSIPYSYSIPNCVVDIIIENLFIKPHNCIPLLFNNPDNLTRCSIVLVVSLHLQWQEERGYAIQDAWYWPKDEQIQQRCQQACDSRMYHSYEKVGYEMKKIWRNLTSVVLQFESEKNQLITQQVKYTSAGWVGTIGGILGLWLGFSFLHLVKYGNNIYEWIKTILIVRAKKKRDQLSLKETLRMISQWRTNADIATVETHSDNVSTH